MRKSSVICFVLCLLLVSNTVFAAGVPRLGTYISEDGNFEITIESTNAGASKLSGQYTAKYSPGGGYFETAFGGGVNDGEFFYVTHGDWNPVPLSIRFEFLERPSGRPYALCDTWTGAYVDGDILIMQGTRSYVSAGDRVVVVTYLGKMKFIYQD